MSDPTPTLADFLLARITEDEDRAHDFEIDQARAEVGQYGQGGLETAASRWGGAKAIGFLPGRVLAECAAKRAIVEHAHRWEATLHETPEGWTEELTTPYRMAMRWTLEQLAQPYSGHPDYRE